MAPGPLLGAIYFGMAAPFTRADAGRPGHASTAERPVAWNVSVRLTKFCSGGRYLRQSDEAGSG